MKRIKEWIEAQNIPKGLLVKVFIFGIFIGIVVTAIYYMQK